MGDGTVKATVTGGEIQGIVGAGTVNIENLIFNRPVEASAVSETAGEPIGRCPFPGLAYFGPDDADQFFGRETAIERLTAAVTRQSFTALVGASGSGKSSVVLAGLAPRLHGLGGWQFSHFRIGNELDHNPFLALARALVPLVIAIEDDIDRLSTVKKLATKLLTGELSLRDVFAESRSRDRGSRILLIADQFEEVFTLVGDEGVRDSFIEVLLTGFRAPATGDRPDLSLILTMRADFYGRALQYRRLADALQSHVENLGPMNREELRAAIVRPAENARVSFDPGLVETLLDDVERMPGSLPLLQFALREMWGRQEKRKITRKSYDEIDGVEGAVARRAEAIFAEMTAHGTNAQMQADFQRLFTRLVTPGEGQADTRRVADRRELGDEVWLLAQRLAGETNRLLVTNAQGSRETAEVVHEALIRNWPTLVSWINRDRAFLSWLRQIKSNVELWSVDPTDDGPLLRGGMLAQASDWFTSRGDDFSANEHRYIEASLALRERDEERKEAARQAEIERQHQFAETAIRLATEQRRRTRLAVIGGIIALMLAIFGGWEALRAKYQTAATQLQQARTISTMAREATDRGDATTGLLLALEVMPDPAQTGARPRSANAAMALLDAWLRHREIATMIGHTDTITSVAFSPDGKRVVTASDDHTARVWDLAGPTQVAIVLRGHTDIINSAAFSPDGKRVVTASDDHTARVWNLAGATPVATVLSGHTDAVNNAAFSPDGTRVVTASDDHTARVWDLAGPTPLATVLSGHTDAVNSAAFSPDGKRVVTVSDDHTARIWNLAGRSSVAIVLNGHTDVVTSAAFSPDGTRVVTASADRTARVWDLAGPTPVATVLDGHTDAVNSAAFSPDGKRVVTASDDHTARVWNLTGPAPVATVLDGHTDAVTGAVFSPDGKRVVTASDDQTARVWDLAGTTPVATTLGGHTDIVTSVAFSPDNTRVVTASADHTARIWDIAGAIPVATVLSGHADTVTTAAFSPDGRRVVTGSADHTVRVWNLAGTTPVATVLNGHSDAVTSAAFSPDGRRVVTASLDTTARVWDLAKATPIATVLRGHTDIITCAAFSPDGTRVVTASADRTARVWNLARPDPIATVLSGHTNTITSAAFSPDGKQVVTASADHTARVWDLSGADPVATVLSGHTDIIASAEFSPDGNRVVTASWDHTARVWDLARADPVATVLRGHTGPVRIAEFSPDGKRVVTASDDDTVRVWDLAGAVPVARVLRGHTGPVRIAAFSPDGTRVVTASGDNMARVWDLAGEVPVATELPGHTGWITSAAFSPHGERVVTASADDTAIVYPVPQDDDLVLLARRSVTRCLTANQRDDFGLLPLKFTQDSDRNRVYLPPCSSWVTSNESPP
jgi:WD40 repeat protein